ncbi:hypothetical protein C8Q75DRAFT_775252 [Abortiporus biennis]|nr:hypothetical protein C8Q75DRAFT_775252 [Abortiporus biennis]
MYSVTRLACKQTARVSSHRLPVFISLHARTLATATAEQLLDVTNEIEIDHNNVRDLFERYKLCTNYDDKDLLPIANTLIREMSIHGDAEEISVYNDYDRIGLGRAVDENKTEHAEVKKLVFKTEHIPVQNEHFDVIMTEAVTAFLKHAEEEELHQHPKIRERLSASESDSIAREFLKARKSVPVRPHPLSLQSGGTLQKAMGMHGRVQDKIVESVTGREYVDLKYEHPEI